MSAVPSSFVRFPAPAVRPVNDDQCDADSAELLERLLERYRRDADNNGYQRAINDLIASLVWTTEQYLQKHPQQDARKLLYAFVEHLEADVKRLPHTGAFVEGGLGI